LKAEERQSRHLNEPQPFTCEGPEVVFEQPRLLPGSFDLGARIRGVRTRQNISQKELAERTGLTPSSISQVEKNQIFPSLPALFRMAESLSVPVGAFFTGQAEEPREGVFLAGIGTGVRFARHARAVVSGEQLLPPGLPGAGVDGCLVRLPPGARLQGHFFQHRGEEIGCVLAGRLRVQLNGQSRDLGPGDALYLRRDTPERWENAGEGTAELFWVRVG
ncbi:MAG: cupin domain-containing protein, partial [Desulfobulbus sp.]|nr:cupin domain-containing protein [Desulfobulbus sp.]